MSVYKDMMMLEMESPNEMYSDMMKTIKKSDEKKALKRLIDEYGIGRVYYMFQTNRRAFFQAVLQNWATHKQLMKAKNLKDGVRESVNEGSLDWEKKHFPWANKKEQMMIAKLVFSAKNGIEDIVKQQKKNPSSFKNHIKRMVKKGLHESINEASVSQVRSTISRVKKQLMKKWAKKGGYENFGQKELRNLRDKFEENPYGSPQERQISKMLDAFDNWAMNYSGDMRETVIKEAGGVEKILNMARNNSYGKIGGQTVDGLTANLFKAVYDKAPQNAKDKINTMNEKQLVRFMGNLWNKFGKQVSLRSA